MTFFPGGKKFAKILRASGLYHCPGDSKKEGKEIHPDRSKLLMSHILDNPGKSKKKGIRPETYPCSLIFWASLENLKREKKIQPEAKLHRLVLRSRQSWNLPKATMPTVARACPPCGDPCEMISETNARACSIPRGLRDAPKLPPSALRPSESTVARRMHDRSWLERTPA